MSEEKLMPRDALSATILFHDTYERLAPQFGYKTREDTKVFDPESKNGRLMLATVTEVLAAVAPRTNPTGEEVERVARAICGWTPNVTSWAGICEKREDGDALQAIYHQQARAAISALSSARPPKMADLLTEAIGDITAALIIAGKAEKVGCWTKKYVEALNEFDGDTGTSGTASKALKVLDAWLDRQIDGENAAKKDTSHDQ